MTITLLYQVSHYIRVQKQRNIKSWDQQNYLVIRGFCYIRPLYNEVPLYQVSWNRAKLVTYLSIADGFVDHVEDEVKPVAVQRQKNNQETVKEVVSREEPHDRYTLYQRAVD